jgi:hypothetical protein
MIKAVLTLILWTGAAASAMADQVEPISIVVAPEASSASQLNVSVTITNNGDTPIKLSERRLPFGWGAELPNDQFTIYTPYGDQVPYYGHLAEIAESDNQYTTLAPHASVTGIVDIAPSYSFWNAVNDGDRWRVSFNLRLGEMAEGEAPDDSAPDYASNPNRLRVVHSNEITVHFNTSPSARVSPQAENDHVDEPMYLNGNVRKDFLSATSPPDGSSVNDPRGTCSPDQLLKLDQAFHQAGFIAGESLSAIASMYPMGTYDGSTVAAGPFRDYFGDPGSDPINSHYPASVNDYRGLVGSVVSRYTAVTSMAFAQTQQKKYLLRTSCDCRPTTKPNVVGYIRDVGGETTFCPKFFTFQATFGPESQALTLMHEITHFRYNLLVGSQYVTVAPTGDFSYGRGADRTFLRQGGAGYLNADTYERYSTAIMKARGNAGW